MLDLNVKGPFYLTRAMLPHLDAASAASAAATTDALAEAAAPGGGDDRDDSGDALALAPTPSPARVINVGSVAGIHPQNVPTHAYDVSKASRARAVGTRSVGLVRARARRRRREPSPSAPSLSDWGPDCPVSRPSAPSLSRPVPIGPSVGRAPDVRPLASSLPRVQAALHHLTRKLAAEFARRGGGDAADHSITVNAIAPGFVPSRMSAGLAAWGADTAALKVRALGPASGRRREWAAVRLCQSAAA